MNTVRLIACLLLVYTLTTTGKANATGNISNEHLDTSSTLTSRLPSDTTNLELSKSTGAPKIHLVNRSPIVRRMSDKRRNLQVNTDPHVIEDGIRNTQIDSYQKVKQRRAEANTMKKADPISGIKELTTPMTTPSSDGWIYVVVSVCVSVFFVTFAIILVVFLVIRCRKTDEKSKFESGISSEPQSGVSTQPQPESGVSYESGYTNTNHEKKSSAVSKESASSSTSSSEE